MWQVLAGRVVSGFGQAGMMVLAAVVITGQFFGTFILNKAILN